MFLIRHTAWMTPLDFLVVSLESHTILHYYPTAMLKRIGSSVRGEIPEAVIMCSDPLPICPA
jgi:hypothetical protein